MRSERKNEHIKLALQQHDPRTDSFAPMRLVHNSLPGFDLDDVVLKTSYFQSVFDYPFYINAMTGGSNRALEVNKKLAQLARHFGLAMAVGSQHAALDDPAAADSYRIVRQEHKDGFIIGNVSANASVADAQRAIAMIDADALSIHINVAQELIMAEGDRKFSHWLDNIQAIQQQVSVPVIVKEVGFGMSQQTIETLDQAGIKHIDVSGRGGTNFIAIENQRLQNPNYNYLREWGLTTLESLIEAERSVTKAQIIASGGIVTPLDVIKSLVLGAKAVGISGYFLKLSQGTVDEMIEAMAAFIADLCKIMVLVGKQNVAGLPQCRYQLQGHNYETE